MRQICNVSPALVEMPFSLRVGKPIARSRTSASATLAPLPPTAIKTCFMPSLLIKKARDAMGWPRAQSALAVNKETIPKEHPSRVRLRLQHQNSLAWNTKGRSSSEVLAVSQSASKRPSYLDSRFSYQYFPLNAF